MLIITVLFRRILLALKKLLEPPLLPLMGSLRRSSVIIKVDLNKHYKYKSYQTYKFLIVQSCQILRPYLVNVINSLVMNIFPFWNIKCSMLLWIYETLKSYFQVVVPNNICQPKFLMLVLSRTLSDLINMRSMWVQFW